MIPNTDIHREALKQLSDLSEGILASVDAASLPVSVLDAIQDFRPVLESHAPETENEESLSLMLLMDILISLRSGINEHLAYSLEQNEEHVEVVNAYYASWVSLKWFGEFSPVCIPHLIRLIHGDTYEA